MIAPVERLARYHKVGWYPPVLIFVGDTGVGRRKAAYDFIKGVRCDVTAKGVFCAEDNKKCVVCQRIDGRQDPLLTVVPEGTFLKVSSVRALTAAQVMVPKDSARFIVIEDLSNASSASWNALLKALEQPPARTHYILLTASRGTLTTIASRGTIFYFPALLDADIEKLIAADPLSSEVWKKLSAVDKPFLLRAVEGSWGKLHSLLINDQALKCLLKLVHNFTVRPFKTEYFKLVKEYHAYEKAGSLSLTTVFRTLFEAVLWDKPLTYAKRLKRMMTIEQLKKYHKLIDNTRLMPYQTDRLWEYLYLCSH